MAYDWKPISDRTWQVIEQAVPGRFDPRFACFLWAATLAEGMKPFGCEMAAGGAVLPDQRGMDSWGIMVNPAENNFYVTCDAEVDTSTEPYGYNGHCWVQRKTGEWDWRANRPEVTVFDAMGRYTGPAVVKEPLIVYHPKPSLLRSIKRHFKAEIAAVRKAVKKDTEYLRMCAELAQGK